MAASRIRIAASSLRLHLSMLMLFRHRVTSPAGVVFEWKCRAVMNSSGGLAARPVTGLGNGER